MKNISIQFSFVVLLALLVGSIGCVEKTSSSKSPVAVQNKAAINKKKAQAEAMRNQSGSATKGKAQFANINTVNRQSLKKTQQPIKIKGGFVTVGGWARSAAGPAKEVFVTIGKKTVRAKYGLDSSYLGTSLKNNKFNNCGFSARTKIGEVGRGNHIISVKVVHADGTSVVSKNRVRISI